MKPDMKPWGNTDKSRLSSVGAALTQARKCPNREQNIVMPIKMIIFALYKTSYNMGQSISQLYVHLVFQIAYNSPKIQNEDINRLYSYIKNYTDSLRCPILAIGGMPDHIHILINLGKDLSISEFVRNIKANTSRWLKTINPHYRLFFWQNGYGAFSVSPSGIKRTTQYIRNQNEHHRYRTMEEEVQWLLEYCNRHIPKIK